MIVVPALARGGSVAILGPNREVVREYAVEPSDESTSLTWDGRDVVGNPVPPEAYAIVLGEVGPDGRVNYSEDDLAGERIKPARMEYQPEDEVVSYVLPVAARVLVRAGLDSGPSLRNVTNWEPRLPGLCRDSWDGTDERGHFRFVSEATAKFSLTAYRLPEPSVILFGPGEEYTDWFRRVGGGLARRPWHGGATAGPHWRFPIHLEADPALTVRVGGSVASADTLSVDKALQISVDIEDDEMRRHVLEQVFEFVVFVDGERVSEMEQATLPFNQEIEVPGKGLHTVAVNLVTERRQVGVWAAIVAVDRD